MGVLGVVVSLLVSAGAVGAVTVDTAPHPAAVLAATRAFVAAEASFSFGAEIRLESHDPGDDGTGAGASVVQRLRLDGVARLPSEARYTVDDGAAVSEVLVVDGRAFTRTAGRQAPLDETKWAEETDTDRDASGVVRPEGAALPDPRDVGEPQDVGRLLDAIRAPRRAPGATVVQGAVDVRAAFGGLADTMESATVDLTTGPGGRLDELTLRIEGTEVDLTGRYRFSEWGVDHDIAVPPPGLVDRTPSLDEEGIAAYDDAPLLQPAALPAGWKLVSAGIVTAEESAEGCAQVSVDYENTQGESGFLYLFLLPASCEGLDGSPRGARPFTAGRYRGFAVVDGPSTFVQLTVGRTVVQADSDLDPADLARLLARLVPLDLAAPPPATLPAIGSGRASA